MLGTTLFRFDRYSAKVKTQNPNQNATDIEIAVFNQKVFRDNVLFTKAFKAPVNRYSTLLSTI